MSETKLARKVTVAFLRKSVETKILSANLVKQEDVGDMFFLNNHNTPLG